MDRWSARLPDGRAVHAGFGLELPKGDPWERIAAYEDTGLTPEEIPQWIPVSERLPDHSNDVLIYGISDENGEPLILISTYCEKTFGGQFLGSKGWAEPFPYFSHDYTITHWMPLPQPPKGEHNGR